MPPSLCYPPKLAYAALTNVTLWAQSDDQSINGNGLSSIHEGAAINYFFLGSAAQTLVYDDENNWIYFQPIPDLKQYFSVYQTIVQMTVATEAGTTVTIDDAGVLSFEGSSDFYAQKNINDPYSYSKTSFAVLQFNDTAPADAIPFKIILKKEDDSAPSSAVSSEPVPSSEPATTVSTAEPVTSSEPVTSEEPTPSPETVASLSTTSEIPVVTVPPTGGASNLAVGLAGAAVAVVGMII